MIKTRGINFPKYDSCKDLISDFLALVEDKHEMPKGADIYLVTRNPKMKDDMCHSINFAAVAMWHYTQRWPDLAKRFRMKLTPEQSEFIAPAQPTFDPELDRRNGR